jgi:hypothetical protein
MKGKELHQLATSMDLAKLQTFFAHHRTAQLVDPNYPDPMTGMPYRSSLIVYKEHKFCVYQI